MSLFQHICHSLFGWDYMLVAWGSDGAVRRVRYLPNGRPYSVVCGVVVFLDEPRNGRWHVPLTFASAKKEVAAE